MFAMNRFDKRKCISRLENNGYLVEWYDKENGIYSATATWSGRVLYGTIKELVYKIFGE